MIFPGVSWACGEIELAWNRVEVGGDDEDLWWTAKGRVWTPSASRKVATVQIRNGAYCLDTGRMKLTSGQHDSLHEYLAALEPSRIPAW